MDVVRDCFLSICRLQSQPEWLDRTVTLKFFWCRIPESTFKFDVFVSQEITSVKILDSEFEDETSNVWVDLRWSDLLPAWYRVHSLSFSQCIIMTKFAPGKPDLALENQQVLEYIYQFPLHKPHVAIEATHRLKVHEIQGCAASCYRAHIRKELSKQRRGKYCSQPGDRSKITHSRMTDIQFWIAAACCGELGGEENDEIWECPKFKTMKPKSERQAVNVVDNVEVRRPSFSSWFQAAPRSPLLTAAEFRKITIFQRCSICAGSKARKVLKFGMNKVTWHYVLMQIRTRHQARYLSCQSNAEGNW